MSKESEEYEKFIHSLVENIQHTGRDIRNLNYGVKNKLKGKSGQKHQIDVSFEDYSYDEPSLVLIECKRYEDNVEVDVPKILKYNNDDILKELSSSKGIKKSRMIITTTSDLSGGAKRLASYENIFVKKVNHGAPYGFRYEDTIQVAEKIEMTDKVSGKLSGQQVKRR